MSHIEIDERRMRVVQRHISVAAIDVACDAFHVTPTEILSSQRSQQHISQARQVAMYLAHVVGQL